MPRKMSHERENEFEELSKFIDFYATTYLKIEKSSNTHPSNVLLEIIEKFGKSKAFQGLKQAVNDTIEQTQHLDLNQIKEIDQILSLNGITSISLLRQRYWSKFKKIIARGKIKGETEYYLVRGLLCGSDVKFETGEIENLENLISEFEKNT